MTKPDVAVLGTGRMGSAMTRRLRDQGFAVRVWNRRRDSAEKLTDVGATVSDSVPEAIRGADVVLTMLFDAAATSETIEPHLDAFGPDAVWLQSGTIGPDASRELARRTAGHVAFVDMPVLGAPGPAADGGLVLLPSGDRSVEDRVRPVLDALGDRHIWVSDEAGRGSVLKLVVNAWLATLTEGIAQSVQLARGLGFDGQLFLDAIAGKALDASYGSDKGALMVEQAFAPQFSVDSIAKDVELALDAAEGSGFVPDLLTVVREHLAQASSAGHGDDDIAAVVRTFTQ